jgi:hypothetical protein
MGGNCTAHTVHKLAWLQAVGSPCGRHIAYRVHTLVVRRTCHGGPGCGTILQGQPVFMQRQDALLAIKRR